MDEHWRTTPIYDDVKPFMDHVPYPVYFVTNSDDDYVFSAVKNHALSLAGVITSEQAKYSKPRKEIFQYALKKTNLKSNEVIHIGDSLTSDVECPSSIGIKAIWLNRENKEVPTGVTSTTELKKVLDLYHRWEAGEISMDDLKNDLWEYGGIRLEYKEVE